jgi:hypothetical protein
MQFCKKLNFIRSLIFFLQLLEGKLLHNLVLSFFLTLDINHKYFTNFQLQNSLQIFTILIYFVNI